MKKLISIALFFSFLGLCQADIQAPPGSMYTSERKLSRALANIFYAGLEVPFQVSRTSSVNHGGAPSNAAHGLVSGVHRMFRRVGYGFYELFTFHCPTYHGTFKPPYSRCGEDWRIEMHPDDGLSEFPPELGFESYFNHTRTQQW